MRVVAFDITYAPLRWNKEMWIPTWGAKLFWRTQNSVYFTLLDTPINIPINVFPQSKHQKRMDRFKRDRSTVAMRDLFMVSGDNISRHIR